MNNLKNTLFHRTFAAEKKLDKANKERDTFIAVLAAVRVDELRNLISDSGLTEEYQAYEAHGH